MRQCGILAFSFPVSMQGGGGGEGRMEGGGGLGQKNAIRVETTRGHRDYVPSNRCRLE